MQKLTNFVKPVLTYNKYLRTPIATATATTTLLLEPYSDNNTLRLKMRKEPQNYKNYYNNYF